MSDSDLAKIGLVGFFEDLDTKAADWKRTAKIKDGRGGYLRCFENAKVGITAFVDDERLEEYEGEDDRLYCHEGGELYVTIHHDGEFSLMFVAKTFWDRNQHFPDQHWGHILEIGCGVPGDLIEDECAENCFIPAEKYQQGTLEELIAALNAVPGVTYKHLWGDDPTGASSPKSDAEIDPALLAYEHLWETETDPVKAKLDVAIMSAFQKPLMNDEGYDSWKEVMENYAYENAGEVIAGAMVGAIGPYPDAFDENHLRDNLHGIMEPVYTLRADGRASYTMCCDRSGDDVTISVFEGDNGFELEIISTEDK